MDFKKVDVEVIRLFKRTPTPYISDAFTRLDLHSLRANGILPITEFKDPFDHVAGQAVTMRFLPSRVKGGYQMSPYRHTEIIENAPKGSVIVAEGASISQRASQTAMRSGLVAGVTNSPIRDIDIVKKFPLPVFCPGGPIGAKMESYAETMECVGENVPVHIGVTGHIGAMVKPGDVIVGDNNGVLVVPLDYLDEVVNAVKEITKLEEQMGGMIVKGDSWKEIYKVPHAKKYGVKGR